MAAGESGLRAYAHCPPPRGPLIAVGTALTGGPPHRSQRALLTHWAPASGTNVKASLGVSMRDTNRGQPAVHQAAHSFPRHAVVLAPAREREEPAPGRLLSELPNRANVAGHGVVGAVTTHHACQP
jgi:hypothetical protein